jgi:hypothetical protein
MIQKYLSFGKSREDAEAEVDKFLSDPERSQQYLEMRRYANAQKNELMGFEGFLTIGGGFLLGLVGTVGVKYFSALQVSCMGL